MIHHTVFTDPSSISSAHVRHVKRGS